MSTKPIDPTDTYVVRELFACSDGHFMCPGYTHWEVGEACPHSHRPGLKPSAYCLYDRLLLVPTRRSDRQGGGDMWKYLTSREQRGSWGHLPLAPAGLEAGTVISPKKKEEA